MTDAATDLGRLERRMLGASMAATGGLAALGVTWGVLAGSQIVLFDGMFSVIGLGLSWLSLHASALVERGPDERFPFGREALTPLVVTIQGVALLATCIYGAVDALLTIVAGGSDVAAASALAYGALTAVLGGAMWRWVARGAGRSELLAAEATVWMAGAALSVGMVIAFGFVLAVDGTSVGHAGRYADPGLVLIAVVLLAPAPVRMIRTTILELLETAPSREVQDTISAAVQTVMRAHGLDEPYVRMSKVGRKLYIEVDFVVRVQDWHVADGDAVRQAIYDRLSPALPFELWLNIEFTGDPVWAA
jgi:predicted Co/Zn/Cd cation transporter (cation efflux family)